MEHEYEEAAGEARQAIRDLMNLSGEDERTPAEDRARQALMKAAIAWLEQKWGADHPCPYCGSIHWSVGTPLDDFLFSDRHISSTFDVSCDNCGNTVQVNAFTARLLPTTQEMEEWGE